jgi:5-(carboxyamino)imidazole ribonucleotide synthase
VAQDRLAEKAFLNQAGLATVAFARVDDAADITVAFERLGPRLLLKTRHGGYDGKGQVWVEPGEEARAFAALGGRPAIAEAPAGFRRECAVIGARGWNGELALFPMTESRHEDGILRRTLAPAAASAETCAAAQAIARRLLAALDYVGVLGVELFEDGDGALLVNEFAPRVHNTGHWTLDGCRTDQFEQHVRAIAGWPLGPTDAIAKVEMINLLGDEATGWAAFAADPACRVWLYGKPEARPGRKMGHINRILDDDASA